MILRIMMSQRKTSAINKRSDTGFTLFELIVVLGIISTMLLIVLPFCKRSNTNLELKQTGNNIAQILRYAIDLAERRNKRVKFVYLRALNSYRLDVFTDEGHFEPTNNFTGRDKYISNNVELYDMEGFDQDKDAYFIEFNPKKKFLKRKISFCSNDLIFEIKIDAKYIQTKLQSL